MTAATLTQCPETKKFMAVYNGKVLVKSASRQYVESAILERRSPKANKYGVTTIIEAGQVEVPQAASVPQITFTINEKYDFITDMVNMVINKSVNAIILSGGAGMGKTHTVKQQLTAANLKDSDDCEWDIPDTEDEEDETQLLRSIPGDFVVIKGFSTAKGLYRTLYEAKDKIVVLDDVDVHKDPVAANLLKACLDSYDRRIVSWNAELKETDGLPRRFEFTGQVIFITNMPQQKIDAAIRSRCLTVDLTATVKDKLERMKQVAFDPEFMVGYDVGIKNDALNFIETHLNQAKDINLRSLQNIIKIRATSKHWERMSLFFMQNV